MAEQTPADILERPSPNHNARPPGVRIDTVVIHYTGMATAEAALARLCDPEAEVSAHYTIDEEGRCYKHVEEARRAWHAGVSAWRGRQNVNDFSIGIELVNPGHGPDYHPFTEPQMQRLIRLLREIYGRHPIDPANVVGHEHVAPGRKRDPGELFDWERLAQEGLARPDLF